jgi:hypothetical protein
VKITASGVDMESQKVDVPARSVRKRFKPGDHVKVMAGQNADETGLVVSVADNIVTFLSDMSLQEVNLLILVQICWANIMLSRYPCSPKISVRLLRLARGQMLSATMSSTT